MALLVFVALVGLAGVGMYASMLKQSVRQADRDRVTATALARAKAALLDWSAARGKPGGPEHPGELPCPATAMPGTANYGMAANCGAGAIGRLPWRTLGIEELRDGSGEPLWYALDDAFHLENHGAGDAISTSTTATLKVVASNGATLLTPAGAEAAAIVFAPGAAFPGQVRPSAAPSQYLDKVSPPLVPVERDNAVGSTFIKGPVLAADGTAVVNDSLIVLSASELMQAVRKRKDVPPPSGP